MTQTTRKRSAKAGLPPGTLIHIGEKHVDRARILLCEYDESHFEEKEIPSMDGLVQQPDRKTVTWLHVDGLHDVRLLEQIGAIFGLHPLILEDILSTDQRPKLEDHGDYLFVVLKRFNEGEGGRLISEQVSMVFGSNYLVSFQEKEGNLLQPIRERLRNNRGRLRKGGTDDLAHAILDAVVDGYFTIMDHLGEEIEGLEATLMGQPSPVTLRAIQSLKRKMISLRKSVWPLREMVGSLGRSDSSLIRRPSVLYFRDIYDHTIQVIDTIEVYRDMLSEMIDIYLSTISNRMNEIMKVLTIIATVFMPLTFLAGVYGMNFRYMPELEWPWGYFVLWAVMILVAIFMLLYFKRKEWF